MLTLTQHPHNTEIATLVQGAKRTPIYFHPKKNKDLQLQVDDIGSFNTEEFRDRFSITRTQAEMIMKHIKNKTEPDGHFQKIFFKIKQFINESLFTELDLRTSDQQIVVDYPPGNETWGELAINCGASGSGKTRFFLDKIIRNLQGKKKNKRKFLWFSAEFNKDKTMKPLKADKFRYNFTGVDIGEQAYAMSQWTTREDFFQHEVKMLMDSARPGEVAIFDDPRDSAISRQLRPYIETLLRTARHDGIGIGYIVHSIRGGAWTSQSHNSVKYFILFPRTQKGKIRDYLNKELGITLKEAREHVADFASAGRAMQVRIHSPQALISEKLIRLI